MKTGELLGARLERKKNHCDQQQVIIQDVAKKEKQLKKVVRHVNRKENKLWQDQDQKI